MSLKSSLPSPTGALILLITCFGCLVVGEIGSDFSHCLHFFYNETPPTGIIADGYQPICQRYRNQYRFASLYHRQHRTPLFSAYILSPADGKRPKPKWMYEPQLAFSGANPEMEVFTTSVDQNVVESQAVLEDYESSDFTKGHLNPSVHHQTPEDKEATFTLTNIVPQREGSNNGPWSSLENSLLKKLKNYCKGPTYMITGVIPNMTESFIKERVSVPEYMWNAYCCPSFVSNLPKHEQQFFPTYAAVGRNDPNSGEEIVPVNSKANILYLGYDVRRMSLEALEDILAQRLKMTISLFDGDCQSSMSMQTERLISGW